MDDRRFVALAADAANHHGVFTIEMARRRGVSDRLRHAWLELGWIERLGTRTFRFAGAPPSWHMDLAAALGDVGRGGVLDGRSAGALHRLDGFSPSVVELWAPRSARNVVIAGVVRTSTRPMPAGDVTRVDGLRCVTVERLILDSLLFRFSEGEIHNAIDSGLRMRLCTLARLEHRIATELADNAPHRRQLISALIDSGGESSLERRFLGIVRRAGLPRPTLRRVYKANTRVVARIDAEFDGGWIVELAGHTTHSTRQHRQTDAQRHTELTLRGKRVLTFTYDDVHGRPDWMVGALRLAGIATAA